MVLAPLEEIFGTQTIHLDQYLDGRPQRHKDVEALNYVLNQPSRLWGGGWRIILSVSILKTAFPESGFKSYLERSQTGYFLIFPGRSGGMYSFLLEGKSANQLPSADQHRGQR